jgi:phage-related protein
VDAAGEGRFLFGICDLVENFKRGGKQDRGQKRLFNPFPVLPVEQLCCRLDDGGSASLEAGRRAGRVSRRGSAAGHAEILAHFTANLRYRAKMLYYGMNWRVEFLNDDVRAALDAMPTDIGTAFLRIAEMIENYGLERMREPYVKHLQGPLWEMRMKGKDGIARAAYVTATGKRVVVVHVFPKKTQKTPRREIETALRRAKEVK